MGSSPHTRDKFFSFFKFLFILRIIPAYAGQINESLYHFIYSQDHPRIRGTNSSFEYLACSRLGSSPHTRDKSEPVFSFLRSLRIIPAYAGQILTRRLHREMYWDHPRIRGTNSFLDPRKHFLGGSSPHTRDKCLIYR